MDLEKNKNHFGGNTHTTTSNVSTNNFKLNMGTKPQNFGVGIMSNTNNQNKDKPALFNFAIKPANQTNPNFANRKFGGESSNQPHVSGNNTFATSNNSYNNSNKNIRNENVVAQVNNPNNFNLLDLSEGFGNNNIESKVNLLEDVNFNNNYNGNNSQNEQNKDNKNNNLLDPFDIINSLGNNSNKNDGSQNQGFNNSVQTSNLFGVDITKPNNADKAQNLLDAMYSNNTQNNNFVDFSKQNNQINMNMGNPSFNNSNQINFGMGINPMMNNDMMFSGMYPGNNQM